ncbi:MAG TPA: hypothetical protein VJ725_17550 [Thermoanaerobaculia bacterium]|nr:hypothetical protein [Thermoanaerobaculia bacterium]
MATPSSLLREYFSPLKGLLSWEGTAEFGTWLSLRFGTPRLTVREGKPEAVSKILRRRRVFLEGDFLLWVEMGAWEVFEEGKRRFHSGQSRRSLRRAAAWLEAQAISRVEITTDPVGTVFFFDLGSELHVRPMADAEPDEDLWHLYSRDRSLSLMPDGTLEHGPLTSKSRRTKARDVIYTL